MSPDKPGRLLALYSILVLALLDQQTASAAPDVPASRILREPPEAVLRGAPSESGAQGQALAPGLQRASASATEVFYDLAIDYLDGSIYNPDSQQRDAVHLRAYQGEVTDPLIPYVAPKVELRPGETFRLTLRNQLPTDDPSCPETHEDPNEPHCFNTTNVHTHGLWISPSGNSDNVLLKVEPGTTFEYEYKVPPDHPAGTFWYHPHRHGATAMQVSSGMAGPLIIRGDRLPAVQSDGSLAPGDLDTLLTLPSGTPYPERTLVFQQVPYACRDEEGAIKTDETGRWLCDEGDVGTIENFEDQFGVVFSNGALNSKWNVSGRRTSINGQVEPYIVDAQSGQVERWRLIHAGVRDTIRLGFRKLEAEYASPGPGRAARQQFMERACTGEPLAQFSAASDGLTRREISRRDSTVLQPGYREDLLMVFPEPGTYCIIDETLRPEQTVNSESHPRELLGFVEVKGPVSRETSAAMLLKELERSARSRFSRKVRERVLADLADGLKLTAFTPHEDVEYDELTNKGEPRTLSFRIDLAGGAPEFEIGEIDFSTTPPTPLNSVPYDPEHIQRLLELGAVEEWKLTSFTVGHPFHIHVNPFQIVSVLDPQGNEVSGPPAPGQGGIPNQYANLRGVWRDTLFVEQGYMITTRSRYRRYIGDFVLHCHILDHEDEGMMQNVRIALPGTENSGMPTAHH